MFWKIMVVRNFKTYVFWVEASSHPEALQAAKSIFGREGSFLAMEDITLNPRRRSNDSG